MTQTHLSFETIGDLLDDALAPAARRAAEEHLDRCASCRASADQLASMRADAQALPREIAPPAELWSGIRARIDGPPRVTRGPAGAVRAWRSLATSERAWLAAAAVLVAVTSAGMTALAVRGGPAGEPVMATERVPMRIDPTTDPARTQLLPASVREVERNLAPAVAALERTLAERRQDMLPRTAATLEHSLKVIDEAIAEARAACVSDSLNDALVDALSRGYEQKIDLLKRAAELAPRT